jgi:alkyldihydroxyacetonephosphate synthase
MRSPQPHFQEDRVVRGARALDVEVEIGRGPEQVGVVGAHCAQAGVVLEALDNQLSKTGFILGHDPWTVPVATLGGAISTNSVGYRAGKYGSMGDQVLGLEAVLPSGEILRTRAVAKTSTGLNLNSLLVGGEGCFGIVTEATIRIFPTPEKRSIQALRFESFEIGYRAIQEIFRQGLRPALLDFGDADGKFAGGAVLYIGFEGIAEIVAAQASRARQICAGYGSKNWPQEEADRFWRERHTIARRFMQNRRQRRENRHAGRHGHDCCPRCRNNAARPDCARVCSHA